MFSHYQLKNIFFFFPFWRAVLATVYFLVTETEYSFLTVFLFFLNVLGVNKHCTEVKTGFDQLSQLHVAKWCEFFEAFKSLMAPRESETRNK